jgi:hypothetical protein
MCGRHGGRICGRHGCGVSAGSNTDPRARPHEQADNPDRRRAPSALPPGPGGLRGRRAWRHGSPAGGRRWWYRRPRLVWCAHRVTASAQSSSGRWSVPEHRL